MADCALKHQFPSLSSQQRWQHHHTYNIFWWKSVPDVCTSTQKSVIRRSQGWSRWLFTITFHKQHHVTTVVYAYLLQMMLRECATAISLFHIFFNIYPPVHPFYNVCIAVHGSFLSNPPPPPPPNSLCAKTIIQATMLTVFKTQEFHTPLARPCPRPHHLKPDPPL